MFPLQKTGITECQHCKNTLTPKEMPPQLKEKFTVAKQDAKRPIWQWAGLLLLVGFYKCEDDRPHCHVP